MDWGVRFLCPWDSPGQNTGVGSLSLFQRIFPTQGLNPGLRHCRQILYQLSPQVVRVKLKLESEFSVGEWCAQESIAKGELLEIT